MNRRNLSSLFLALSLLGGFSRAQDATKKDAPPAEPNTPKQEETAAKQETSAETPAAKLAPTSSTERNLRLNFRGVPLEMVLNYLSEAAGFIIVLETEPKGKVDVWSNQPLNKEEAVDLLNTILNKNGYAAIRNGRTLKIVTRNEAKMKDLPVNAGNKPGDIPKSERMVTQVIPVRHANATQLTRDLTPLLDTSYATLTANDSANSLVLTDTQANVHRMVQIVEALDTSIQNVSSIRVFQLKFADAKELAAAFKDLFAPPQQANQNNNNRSQQFFNRFGGGGPGGFGGGARGGGGGAPGGGGGGASAPGTGAANAHVTAIADERTNSLIVSAPEDMMHDIADLIEKIDVNVADITELRVFPLVNSDPLEMADLFAQLFPDDTMTTSRNGQNNNNNRFPFQFGGFGGNNRRTTQNNQSERTLKRDKVVAVPDQRTSSLIVSASRDMMPEIEAMIRQLDSSPARKQRVYVYSLENADVEGVAQVVRDIFERTSTTANRNNQNQRSQLDTRSTQLQNQGSTSTAARNNGFGANGGQGGAGGTFR